MKLGCGGLEDHLGQKVGAGEPALTGSCCQAWELVRMRHPQKRTEPGTTGSGEPRGLPENVSAQLLHFLNSHRSGGGRCGRNQVNEKRALRIEDVERNATSFIALRCSRLLFAQQTARIERLRHPGHCMGVGAGGGHSAPGGGKDAVPASVELTACPISHPPVSSSKGCALSILVTPEPTWHLERNNKYL